MNLFCRVDKTVISSGRLRREEVAGTLHGSGHTTLELQRSACDAAGENLALLIEELLKELRILIVDILDAAAFETAIFLLLRVYRKRSEITDFAVCCHGLVLLCFYSLFSHFDCLDGCFTCF